MQRLNGSTKPNELNKYLTFSQIFVVGYLTAVFGLPNNTCSVLAGRYRSLSYFSHCTVVWKAIWFFIHNFPISEIIYRYREFEFPISGNKELFSDIGNSFFPILGNNSRYREMNLIFRYLEMISRYQEMISRYPEINRITDIGK